MLLSEGVKEEVGPTGVGGRVRQDPQCCARNPTIRAQVPGEGVASFCWRDPTSHLVVLLWPGRYAGSPLH